MENQKHYISKFSDIGGLYREVEFREQGIIITTLTYYWSIHLQTLYTGPCVEVQIGPVVLSTV